MISQVDIQESASNAEARRKGDSLRCLVVPTSKSQDFFARLLVRRQTLGNCVRCGHKNPQPKHKTCPRCLAAVARRKKAAAEKPTVETRALVRRVESLELAIANLQLAHAKIYGRAYRAGQKSIRKAVKSAAREVERLDALRYADAHPNITKQELSNINHAYASRHNDALCESAGRKGRNASGGTGCAPSDSQQQLVGDTSNKTKI